MEDPMTFDTMDDSSVTDTPTEVYIWHGSMSEGCRATATLLVKHKNALANPQRVPQSPTEAAAREKDVRAFLWYLQYEMPIIKLQNPQTRSLLESMFKSYDQFRKQAPKEILEKVDAVREHFRAQKWGQTAVEDDDSEQEDMTGIMGAAAAAASSSSAVPPTSAGFGANTTNNARQPPLTVSARIPPPDHPIWGANGIMGGLAYHIGKRGGMVYSFNRTMIGAKVDAKQYGDNGLRPGQWWPLQIAAVFHGAHGAPGSGISGDAERGAYSIVIAARSTAYQDIDEDHGDVVYYSADRAVSLGRSRATQSLHASRIHNRPVRVLRSAGSTTANATSASKVFAAWAPSVGVRYDGLYRVVACFKKTGKHGQFEQFQLVRENGQPPIMTDVPTAQQVQEYGRIRRGY